MSVLCSLTQISSHLLSRITENPSVLELFRSVGPIDSEEIKIDNIYGLSTEYIQLLSEVLAEPDQAVGQLTLWDIEEAESWRREYTEEYKLIKSEFYKILIEGKTAPILDLGKTWDAIGYIFRGGVYSEPQPFLVDQTVDKEIRVETVFGGKNIEVETRYHENPEVQMIANALSNFSEEVIRKRFEQGQREQPNLYRYNWSEEAYEGCLSYCTKVKDFYINAANQASGILICLG